MTQQEIVHPNVANGAAAEGGNIGDPSACPVCQRSDKADKVSNVIRSERGELAFAGGETAHYETELGMLLAEPEQPHGVSPVSTFLGVLASVMVLGLVLGGVALLRWQDLYGVPDSPLNVATRVGIVWFALVIPVLLIWRHVHSANTARDEMPRWLEATRRWSYLYYCRRDDLVYIPRFKQGVSPDRVDELLYPRPASSATAQATSSTDATAQAGGSR